MELDLYPGLWLGRPGEPGRPGRALAEVEALPEAIRELRDRDAACRRRRWTPAPPAWPRSSRNLPAAPVRDALERFRDAGYLTRPWPRTSPACWSCAGLPEDEIGRRRFLHRDGHALAHGRCLARHAGRRAMG